jgi:hypothetical protein
LALASCAGSRFRETNHEFVQSNKCEAIQVACVAVRIIEEGDASFAVAQTEEEKHGRPITPPAPAPSPAR